MIAGLIRFSLIQRLFVLVVALALLGAGGWSWWHIPIDAFPDISPTQVKVILKAPGMTAEEIETQITWPIETELLGIPDQQLLRSTTKYAITDITLDFQPGTDIYWARQQVNERLQAMWDDLPENIAGGMAPMSTPLSEMFMFTLENPMLSLSERRQILSWDIRPALRTVPGVADVNILGGFAKTFEITPDPVKMVAAGITMADLKSVIVASNVNGGIGRLNVGNSALILRSEGRYQTIEDIRNQIIPDQQQNPLRIADIATVQVSHLARYGSVTRNGEETVEALVIALKNANTKAVVEGVSEKLKEIERTLPAGSRINVFYNRADLIDRAVSTISSALLFSVVLVIAILALFLGNIRAAVVVSLSLPLAALTTFILMYQFGLSANLMSLGGLVIAIGMIVDSSVVVVENIVNELGKGSTLPRRHLVYRAVKDVSVPVVAGTLIVIIVFSPLLTLTGLEGKLFVPVAFTIVLAMLSALLLSLTIIPVFASQLVHSDAAAMPTFMQKLQDFYEQSLLQTLAKPQLMIAILSATLLLSALAYWDTGKTFMPVMDEGDIIVQLEKSPNISLKASTELDIQIENALLAQIPEIRQIVARVGSDEIGLDPMGLNETDIFMELKPREEWRFADKAMLKQAIREVIEKFPGINIGFTQPIQMRVSEMLTGSTGDVAIKLFGADMHMLATHIDQIAAVVSSTAGSIDVQTAIIEGGTFTNVQVIPEVAQRYGLSTKELAEYLSTQIESVTIGNLIQGARKTPLVFGAMSKSSIKPSTLAELTQLQIVMPDGRLVPLAEVARLQRSLGPLLLERENAQRFAVINVNVINRDVVGFVEELQQRIQQEVTLPAGYAVSFGGEFENQQRATRNLLLVVPVSLALVLLILFTTFRSLAKAIGVLLNIPFAVMGGIIALWLSGHYLSVPASVGFIALLGIAVLNGVVMLSYFDQCKLQIREINARIRYGAGRRLRPILMTATTAMFGLAPLVLASGPGAEVQKPLAIVVIGGLITSTVTTLYLLPLIYRKMELNSHD
jgi:cobalt-zinc-cadmium resistance protein CzcA